MSHFLKKLLCGGAAALAVAVSASPFAQVQTPPGNENPSVTTAFDKLGRSFIVNKGQYNRDAVMVTRQDGLDFWVTKTGITLDAYQLGRKDDNPLLKEMEGIAKRAAMLDQTVSRLQKSMPASTTSAGGGAE